MSSGGLTPSSLGAAATAGQMTPQSFSPRAVEKEPFVDPKGKGKHEKSKEGKIKSSLFQRKAPRPAPVITEAPVVSSTNLSTLSNPSVYVSSPSSPFSMPLFLSCPF
jgi:hypothetical protein